MKKKVLCFWPVLVVVALAGALASCGTSTNEIPPPASVDVEADLDAAFAGDTAAITFRPDAVPGQRGQRIIWHNRTDATLTLLFGDAPVSAPQVVIEPGDTGEVSVNSDARQGRYKYTGRLSQEGRLAEKDPYIDIPPPPTPRDTMGNGD